MRLGTNLRAKIARAFTLSELLMSVLVISIVMVAMAPVITKRVSDNISVADVKYDGRLFTVGSGSGNCNMMSAGSLTLNQSCTYVVEDGVYSINAILVGAGGNGSQSGTETRVHKVIVQKTEDNEQTKTQTYDLGNGFIDNIKITYMSAGGGGGGSAWGEELTGEPQSQEDCDAYNAYFADKSATELDKNFCMTKYNVGDTNGPRIHESVVITDHLCRHADAGNCCFKRPTGNLLANHCTTSATTTSGSSDFTTTYSGCNRTVCQYGAAKTSCENWTNGNGDRWSIPSESIVKKIGKPLGAAGDGNLNTLIGYYYLQLCNANIQSATNGTSVGCSSKGTEASTTGLCWLELPDTTYSKSSCLPSAIWVTDETGTSFDGLVSSIGNLFNMSTSTGEGASLSDYEQGLFIFDEQKALSARCVSSDLGTRHRVSTGGGGGGSPYLKNIEISEKFFETTNGTHQVTITTGAGGKGGTSSSNPAQGSGTIVTFNGYTAARATNPSEFTYSIQNGGNEATNASETTASNGGEQNNGVCKNNSTQIACSGHGPKGEKGEIKSVPTGQNIPLGGISGGSNCQGSANDNEICTLENYSVYSQGGGSTQADGFTVSGELGYGAGGGGGSAYIDEGGIFHVGNGANGKGGIVIIKYDEVTPPISGGGGAGGGMGIIKNIKVNPGDEILIGVGNPQHGIIEGGISAGGGVTDLYIENSETYFVVDFGRSSNRNTKAPGIAYDDFASETQYSEDVVKSSNIQYIKGQDGSPGVAYQFNNTDYHHLLKGGKGGDSGSGGLGGCGGGEQWLYNITGGDGGENLIVAFNCSANVENGTGWDGSTPKFVVPNNPSMGDYGSAGAGGGGGAWYFGNSQSGIKRGTLGKGQNGFVYLWWVSVD